MIALVFLYLTASIFMFGGELNAAILRARSNRSTAGARAIGAATLHVAVRRTLRCGIHAHPWQCP